MNVFSGFDWSERTSRSHWKNWTKGEQKYQRNAPQIGQIKNLMSGTNQIQFSVKPTGKTASSNVLIYFVYQRNIFFMPVVLVFLIHQGYPGDPGPPGPLNLYNGSDARGEVTAVNYTLLTQSTCCVIFTLDSCFTPSLATWLGLHCS